MTSPLIRSAAAGCRRRSGGSWSVRPWAARLDLPRRRNNAIEAPMRMTLLALARSPPRCSLLADTLIYNVNGIQVGLMAGFGGSAGWTMARSTNSSGAPKAQSADRT